MGKQSNRLNDIVRRYSSGDDEGKLAIVTGANSGIGFETARILAIRGMTVILACRNLRKAEAACKQILYDNPEASLVIKHLDLASQRSVKEFGEEFIQEFKRLDLLVNNGGVMLGPHRLTEDGFEMLLGTNHFGHFTLTAMLMDHLLKTAGARVVTISSIAHFKGLINFDDLQSEKHYSRKASYRQSKLANLLFAYELDRKVKKAGKDLISVAVHPGITSTNIVKLPPALDRLKDMVLMNTLKGALPSIMGCVDPGIKGGEFIGPDGYGQIIGFPAVLKSGEHSYDEELSLRLWNVSEKLCGIKFNL